MDISIEYLQEYRVILYEYTIRNFDYYTTLITWTAYITVLTGASALICHCFAKQAIGSGIPELKVIMCGFKMKNYLSLQTMIGKIFGLTLALGSGLPVGKEGPFVHIGAIVASLLTRITSACRYQAFFSSEGREMQMLSSGCAVGIACTFSAPAGAVLYGIESTSRFFAVRNYWRAFFATTCSALIFRFANAAIIPPEIAGTITAYYQTYFPNSVFVVEELPVFALIGVFSGLFGALFVFTHRRIALFREKNRLYLRIFNKNFTFRETLADFIANCTFMLSNITAEGCSKERLERWVGINHEFNALNSLAIYFCVYFILVAICISLAVPAGIFVPSFVIGACGGRLIGEIMALLYPQGLRGPDGPKIFPGLYAVVGAAAYTGSVTHSLSIAVIVCETTGQLSPLLPVLIALMIGNAISSFLQPSIYESMIEIKNLPHLADLPPSRISVHKLKVENVMIHNVLCITRSTTYGELRELLLASPHLRSYPLITDSRTKILLGSVARKYLNYLLYEKLGPDSMIDRKRINTTSDLLNHIRRNSRLSANNVLTDRNISGNTLLASSPLHEDHGGDSPLAPLLQRQADADHHVTNLSVRQRAYILRHPIHLDEIAIDPAPFQLVLGTSLYRVHTLFSLLGLNHAYITNRGKLMGVISIKELRNALANIYSRGAIPTYSVRKSTVTSPHRLLLNNGIEQRMVTTVATQTLLEDQVIFGVDSDIET
ncbi:voltage gated chloride channel family protein [Loa loa]|uniref:Voltage gated chloride channel family protein n=1 Tax=Loa loa TaxID=7209 RepID=A0A1S0UFK0_LOALO|nr:voltage gated chloride channel family protein [Loa loa]EJD74333.1 voltage gated chloride channel family protein [Loa loa]